MKLNHKHRSGEHRIEIIFFDAFLLMVKREERAERIDFSIREHIELIKTSLSEKGFGKIFSLISIATDPAAI